jgi:hypothetical protein
MIPSNAFTDISGGPRLVLIRHFMLEIPLDLTAF